MAISVSEIRAVADDNTIPSNFEQAEEPAPTETSPITGTISLKSWLNLHQQCWLEKRMMLSADAERAGGQAYQKLLGREAERVGLPPWSGPEGHGHSCSYVVDSLVYASKCLALEGLRKGSPPASDDWQKLSAYLCERDASRRLPAETFGTGEDPFERAYRKIGWWDGPYSTRSAQEEIRAYWVKAGQSGAQWLARRLRWETHADILEAAASLLADIGRPAIRPMLVELKRQATSEQARTLLGAIRWIPSAGDAPFSDQLVKILDHYLQHNHPELREAACAATAVLAKERALDLLQKRLQNEDDKEVREILREAISDRLGE